MADVIVVGAGVSGLACARGVRQAGLDPLVLEADARPGGVVSSERVDGYLLESGPNTILPTPESMAMIAAAGVSDQMITAPPGAPRFVYAGGRLRRVPWVLSPSGTLRALAEPFIRRRREPGDESLAAFFERRFGREAHARLAAPFVTGIYAGDTRELGIQGVFPRLARMEADFGSVVAGMVRGRGKRERRRLASFRDGMGTLVRGLARGLDIRFDTAARTLAPGWRLEAGAETFEAAAVVLATPAPAAARLLRTVDSDLAGHLGAVCYAPIVVASLGVAADEFPKPLEGFGFLVPREAGLKVLGTLFNSALFPGRAPAGQALLTSFLGGRLSPEAVDEPDDRLWAAVRSDVERVLGLGAGAGRGIRLTRYRRAIPQYRVGHTVWRSRLRADLAGMNGLFLTGNYLDGVSVPAAMEHGARTAEAVIQYIRRIS